MDEIAAAHDDMEHDRVARQVGGLDRALRLEPHAPCAICERLLTVRVRRPLGKTSRRPVRDRSFSTNAALWGFRLDAELVS
jgi:hypothetical protein